MRRFAAAWFVASLPIFSFAGPARAEVVRIELTERRPYADGRVFERFGAYEMRRGRVYFAIDPKLDSNRRVVDLDFAPRNDHGLVEFSADLEMLCPTDLSKASGSLLYDVNNRGNPTCMGQFNGGGADEFLCRHGFIVIWSGWIAETFPGGGRLRLQAPVATQNGQPIRGLVRAEMVANKETDRLNIAQWSSQGSYPPSPQGLDEATLTWRLREKDPRVTIPREQWRLEQKVVEADGQRSQLPLIEMVLSGGFQPGYIYELVYEAEGPLVQGTGLAGIRDLVSFFKRDASERNPLAIDGKPVSQYTLGFGTSQSGRALRMFLYDGFNADEQGRQVFDGVMPHVAGGGLGFFNHRFASPTRHNAQHDNHLFPADVFPFAYEDQEDPFTHKTDGILRRPRESNTVPKVMHTQTSSEYWNRSGSLVHTNPLGNRDARIPKEVRIYAFGGCQHGAGGGVPGRRTLGQLPGNPNDYRPLLRGLLMALDAWVRGGREPPTSVYPRMGALVRWREDTSGWWALPGVRYPEVIQQPEFLDHGPGFDQSRWATREPPLRLGNYIVRVPAYDADDNERDTLLLPSVAVPLATYTSWNLRHRSIGAENELLSLAGGYIPFARTADERQAAGDPRLSIAERYRDFDDYRQKYLAVARELIEKRYVLPEDLPRFEKAVERNREIFSKR